MLAAINPVFGVFALLFTVIAVLVLRQEVARWSKAAQDDGAVNFGPIRKDENGEKFGSSR